MNELYLVGGYALVLDDRATTVADSVLHLRDGKIVSVFSQPGFVPPPGALTLDARGALVLPGFINAHTHLGMTLFRGLGADLPLQRWLSEAIFPVEQKFCGSDLVLQATRVACLELIQSGTTTVNDMYYFGLDTAAALHEAGLRGIVAQAITEASQPDRFHLGEIQRYLDAMKAFPLLIPALAPHSVYTVSAGTWARVLAVGEKHGLRIDVHVSENQQEVEDSLKLHGVTPTAFLDALGLWRSGLGIAAHCVVLDATDTATLGRHRVGIVHNPKSNLKLANGIAPLAALRRAGARVALGTDSTASNDSLDILSEAATAAKIQTLVSGVGAWTALDAVRSLTSEGAAAIGLSRELGSLEPGKAADVVVVDVKGPHAFPLRDPYAHLVHSAKPGDVRHTIVAGKPLLVEGKWTTLDAERILDEARPLAEKIGKLLIN